MATAMTDDTLPAIPIFIDDEDTPIWNALVAELGDPLRWMEPWQAPRHQLREGAL